MWNLLDKIQYVYTKPDVTYTRNIPEINVSNPEGELQVEFIYLNLFCNSAVKRFTIYKLIAAL